jgi:hypothetical protein
MAEHIINTAINIILGMVVSYLVAMLRQRKQENSALKIGVQALLRNKIIETYQQYVERDGWMPSYKKDCICACYEAYEDLGANGVINDYMKAIKELPTVKEVK